MESGSNSARNNPSHSFWPLRLALVWFCCIGCIVIPTLGFEDDEVIFVNLFFHPNDAFSRLPLGGEHGIATLQTSYAGALKTWILSPILLSFPVNAWTVRLPPLLLAVLATLLAVYFYRQIGGYAAALIGGLLLATDPTLLFTSAFDWGPVVLQLLLEVSMLLLFVRWHKSGNNRLLFWAGLMVGLALWEKALFLWHCFGFGLATLVVFWPELRTALTKRNVKRFVGGLALGALPLIIGNLRHHFATFKDNGHYQISGVPSKAAFLRDALDGRAATSFLVIGSQQAADQVRRPLDNLARTINLQLGAETSLWRFQIGLVCILCGFLVVRPAQRRSLTFLSIATLTGWLQSAATRDAGNMPHHAVLFWLDWYGLLSLSGGMLWARLRPLRIPLATLLISLTVWGAMVQFADYGQLLNHPGTSRWTNADSALAAGLERSGISRVVIADWGIRNVLRSRSGERIRTDNQSVPLMLGRFDAPTFVACRKGCAVIRHVKNRDVFPGVTKTLDRGLSQLGRLQTTTTVYDTHGVATFQIIRLQ